MIDGSAGVAQLVRACGSYPQCPGFKSLHRHQFLCGRHQRIARVELVTSECGFAVPSCRPCRTSPQPDDPCLPVRSRWPDDPAARAASAIDDRVAVAVSGGSDSVALDVGPARPRAARALADRRLDSRQPSVCAARVGRRRGVLPRPRPSGSGCRSTSGAPTSGRARASGGNRSRPRRGSSDMRVSSGRRGARRDARRDRAHPGRSGRDGAAAPVFAAPAAAACRRSGPGAASTCVR